MTKLLLVGLLMLSACGEEAPTSAELWKNDKPAALGANFGDALADARAKAGSDAEVLAVCGPSAGHGFYLGAGPQGWTEDAINNGRIAPIRNSDGSWDLLFGRSDDRYVSAGEDGGEVKLAHLDERRNEFSLIVHYPATGVVEVYNFVFAPDGKRYAIWTANKPHLPLLGIAKAAAFVSKCNY